MCALVVLDADVEAIARALVAPGGGAHQIDADAVITASRQLVLEHAPRGAADEERLFTARGQDVEVQRWMFRVQPHDHALSGLGAEDVVDVLAALQTALERCALGARLELHPLLAVAVGTQDGQGECEQDREREAERFHAYIQITCLLARL